MREAMRACQVVGKACVELHKRAKSDSRRVVKSFDLYIGAASSKQRAASSTSTFSATHTLAGAGIGRHARLIYQPRNRGSGHFRSEPQLRSANTFTGRLVCRRSLFHQPNRSNGHPQREAAAGSSASCPLARVVVIALTRFAATAGNRAKGRLCSATARHRADPDCVQESGESHVAVVFDGARCFAKRYSCI